MEPKLFNVLVGSDAAAPLSSEEAAVVAKGASSDVVFPQPFNPFAASGGDGSGGSDGGDGRESTGSVGSAGQAIASTSSAAGGATTQPETDMTARLKMMEEQLREAQRRAEAAEGGMAVADAPAPFVSLPPKSAAGLAIFNDLLNRRRAIFAVSRGLKPKGQVRTCGCAPQFDVFLPMWFGLSRLLSTHPEFDVECIIPPKGYACTLFDTVVQS